MKNVVVVLMIVFTMSLVGGLYNTLAQLDNVQQETTDYAQMKKIPYIIPDVVLSPMTVVLVY